MRVKMNSTKIIAGIAYVASWCVCILPNTPIRGQAYDEPSDDKVLKQIVQKPDEDIAIDTTCQGYVHEEPDLAKIKDLTSHQSVIKTFDHEEYINSEDYDSGDYGDY